ASPCRHRNPASATVVRSTGFGLEGVRPRTTSASAREDDEEPLPPDIGRREAAVEEAHLGRRKGPADFRLLRTPRREAFSSQLGREGALQPAAEGGRRVFPRGRQEDAFETARADEESRLVETAAHRHVFEDEISRLAVLG